MTQLNSLEVTITDPYLQNCVQMVGPVGFEPINKRGYYLIPQFSA